MINPTTVCRFLEALRPGGPWALSAVYPFKETPRVGSDSRCETRVGRIFDDLDAVLAWVRARAGSANCYFTANPLRWHEVAWNRAPGATWLASMEFLFADVDVYKLQGGPAVEDVAERLVALPWPPTFIIDTGGGVQALWRLVVPILGDQPEMISRGRAANQALLEALRTEGIEADGGVVNPVHLLRLPGTLNILSPQKLAAGRKPTMARLVHCEPERVVAAEAFPVVAGRGTTSDEGWGDLEIEMVDEADVVVLPPRLREIVMTGSIEGETLPGDNSRSGWAFHAALHLVRLGWPLGRITGLLLDGPWGVEEKPDPEREAKRTAWRAMQMVSAWTEAERQRFDAVTDADVEAILGDGPVVGQAELNDILGD
jgi:hypothetical protein